MNELILEVSHILISYYLLPRTYLKEPLCDIEVRPNG